MQKKDQEFSKFCDFKAMMEKELGKQVKSLSNNGGEYISNEFKDFLI
jgi:ABC-type transporter MlaC component